MGRDHLGTRRSWYEGDIYKNSMYIIWEILCGRRIQMRAQLWAKVFGLFIMYLFICLLLVTQTYRWVTMISD